MVLVPAEQVVPELLDVLMHMGTVEYGGHVIQQYKHADTRQYLNLDDSGQAWQVTVHPNAGLGARRINLADAKAPAAELSGQDASGDTGVSPIRHCRCRCSLATIDTSLSSGNTCSRRGVDDALRKQSCAPPGFHPNPTRGKETSVSHSLAFSDEQRARLALAELELARLTPLLAATRVAGLSGHQWQVAASLAAAVADHTQRLAELAVSPASRTVWVAIAGQLRNAVSRFEMEADLAEFAAATVADVLGVSSDVALGAG